MEGKGDNRFWPGRPPGAGGEGVGGEAREPEKERVQGEGEGRLGLKERRGKKGDGDR